MKSSGLVNLFFFSILMFSISVAYADETQDARVHFRKGALAYTQGEVTSALAEFQLAFALKPSFKIRYNIGQCLMELGRLDEAYEMFIVYLVEGGESVDPERRAEVTATLEEIRRKLGMDVPEVKIGKRRVDTVVFPLDALKDPVIDDGYIFDPRAANLHLKRKPANMPERDWFGVKGNDWAEYERRQIAEPDIKLRDHLIELSAESKVLLWTQIGSGAVAAFGASLAIAGGVKKEGALVGGGIGILLAGGIALTIQIIVDKMDLGKPKIMYPERLDAYAKAKKKKEKEEASRQKAARKSQSKAPQKKKKAKTKS